MSLAPQRRTFRLLGLTTRTIHNGPGIYRHYRQRLANASFPGQLIGGNAWYRHVARALACYGMAVSLWRVPRVSPAGCNMSQLRPWLRDAKS